MGIVEKSLDASMERLKASLFVCDYVGANLSCIKIAAVSKDDLGLALGLALGQALDSFFARDLFGANEIDFDSRLGSILQAYESCFLAARLAIAHGVSGALKSEAMMAAGSLAGAADDYERLADREYIEMTDYNIDHGQRQFITSICLAKALMDAGDGLSPNELREFSCHFKDWISPDFEGFHQSTEILFQGRLEDAYGVFFDEDDGYPGTGYRSFMDALRASMAAKDIDSAIGASNENSADAPRKPKRAL